MQSYKLSAVLVALTLVLTGCASNWRTYYAEPVDPTVSRGWRVVDVVVNVPASLTTTEAPGLAPSADIVWREDPPGDRRAQVATILHDAAERGASGLQGSRAVRLELDLTSFHALTFEAESKASNAGVHNVKFVATVSDARTGAVLAGPEPIDAALPAFAGAEATAARLSGLTQKSIISDHVAATIAGWLGAGPDARREFQRLGR